MPTQGIERMVARGGPIRNEFSGGVDRYCLIYHIRVPSGATRTTHTTVVLMD
jgi:hypothetical protein